MTAVAAERPADRSIQATLRALERFLLPNACVSCNGPLEPADPDGLLCSRCRWRMKVVAAGCARCGQPAPPIGPCRVCASWPSQLRWARSAVWLGPEVRAVVHRLKYGGLERLGTAAANLITRAVPRPEAGMLCPIPLARGRRRRRGYNQAASIARALSRRWNLPVAEHVLHRPGRAMSQTRMSAGSRGANVAGAFLALAPPGSRVDRDGASASRTTTAGGVPAVIIVDDVFTTGATITAAAMALAEAGWSEMYAVTFARAVPFELRLA